MAPIQIDTVSEIVEIAQHLLVSSPRVLLAVDGRGGAGKSTLARSLAKAFDGAAVVEIDWFHLPQKQWIAEERFDIQRFKNDIVMPFRAGKDELNFFKYNWGYLRSAYDGLESNPTRVKLANVLIVEGCQTLHRSLFQDFDLRIWLEVGATESLVRGKKRDIEEYKLDPAKVAALWEEWSLWQEEMLLRENLQDRADIIYVPGVDNRVTRSHRD